MSRPRITAAEVRDLRAAGRVVAAYPRKGLIEVNGFKWYAADAAAIAAAREPMPSVDAREDFAAETRAELAAILRARGFADPETNAAKLAAEGMGPHELASRAALPPTEVGGLTYTHGIAKREGAS